MRSGAVAAGLALIVAREWTSVAGSEVCRVVRRALSGEGGYAADGRAGGRSIVASVWAPRYAAKRWSLIAGRVDAAPPSPFGGLRHFASYRGTRTLATIRTATSTSIRRISPIATGRTRTTQHTSRPATESTREQRSVPDQRRQLLGASLRGTSQVLLNETASR
jgi:hypothetical protein